MPAQPLEAMRTLHAAIRAGLVQSCHDLSEGGLALALAEMCIGGRLGAAVDIRPVRTPNRAFCATTALFGESNGRFLLEVEPAKAEDLELQFAGLPLTMLGAVSEATNLDVNCGSERLIGLPLEEIVFAWKRETVS